MKSIVIKYSLVVLVLAYVIVSGFLFYIQQESISDLKRQIMRNTGSSLGNEQNFTPPLVHPTSTSTDAAGNTDNMIQRKEESLKSLIPKINDIAGEIKEKSDNYIIIEAKIADLSKLDQFDEKMGGLPMLVKTYKVMVDKNTDFSLSPKKMGELKIGDWVRAFSKEPIYNTTEFTATYMTYLTEEDMKMISVR